MTILDARGNVAPGPEDKPVISSKLEELKSMGQDSLLLAGLMDGMPREITGEIALIAKIHREYWNKKSEKK